MREPQEISFEDWSEIEGEFSATPEALKAGHVVEQRVLVRMPDGSELHTKRVLITKKGLAALLTAFNKTAA